MKIIEKYELEVESEYNKMELDGFDVLLLLDLVNKEMKDMDPHSEPHKYNDLSTMRARLELFRPDNKKEIEITFPDSVENN